MRRVDLHAHTLHSDGTHTAEGLVRLAQAAGLAALAVTDHDTTIGVNAAQAAGAALGVEVLAGVEISAQRLGSTVHVLGYGFHPDDEAFQGFLLRVRNGRDERNAQLFLRLAALGMPLETADVLPFVKGSILARPHFARALVARGYVPDLRTAFGRWLGDGCPAYVVPDVPSPEEAVAAVAAAGGVSVIAHPRQIGLGSREAWLEFLRPLEERGLTGIEVQHPSHQEVDRTFFAALAAELDLVASGGSDFHGDNKPYLALGVGDGTISVGYDTWERLRERRGRRAA